MKITSAQIKELREVSGAGMLDCKKALEANEGNIEAAVEWLNEKGLLAAAKKDDRVAAEGLSNIKVDGNSAVVYEVNSETDFVAKNDKFLSLIDTVGNYLITNKPADLEAALASSIDGVTLETVITKAVSVIGEKISLRRFAILSKTDDQEFGIYIHMGGSISALSVVDGTAEVAKDASMHIAALSPLAISRDEIDADVVAAKEKELTETALEEGKPEHIVGKIVEGQLNKFFSDSVMEEQAFVKDPDQTVGEYLKANNAKVLEFTTFTVGEGIEKEEEDFAAEVLGQMRP